MRRWNILFVTVLLLLGLLISGCGQIAPEGGNTDNMATEASPESENNTIPSNTATIGGGVTEVCVTEVLPTCGENSVNFTQWSDLTDFLRLAVEESFYYMDLSEIYRDSFMDSHNAAIYYDEKTDSGYTNPIVQLHCEVYDPSIEDLSGSEESGAYVTYSMYIVAQPFAHDGGTFTYEVYHCTLGKYKWNRVIYVYYGDEVVTKVYYCASVDMELDYFVDLFEKYGVIV